LKTRPIKTRIDKDQQAAKVAPQENTPPPEVALCMAVVPDVRAEVVPFDGGIGVVLTSPDNAEDLRQQAHAMSGKGTQYACRDGKSVPVSVTTQDIDDGAFVVFAPGTKGDASELADSVREDAEALTSGKCPTGDNTVTARE
jgi:hypothetical protein